ncbi:hypothetical protein JCM19053_247 [Vibrio sp. JCM 19053]|nr:hypothetical protein JCM19053_247 [Vibrio sp. JCM 19053]
MKSKWLLSFSGLSGLLSVALGAFAAHGLKATLAPYLLGVFETGVLYQFIHTLAIVFCAILLLLNLGQKAQKYFFSLRRFALLSASFVLAAVFTRWR